MASPEARERFARKNEEDDLRRAFDFLDRKKDGKIDEDDLTQVFMSLQHRTKKGEINDMIWEVDEDCDNAVNWKAWLVWCHMRLRRGSFVYCFSPTLCGARAASITGIVMLQEFQVMYHRCRNDIAGTEPRRLFNVAEFVMNDKQGLGTVSMENAMQIMYLRYGRHDLDAQLQDIFGTSDLNSGKTLTLTEFLSSLHASQVKQLRNRVTAKTYVAPTANKKAAAG